MEGTGEENGCDSETAPPTVTPASVTLGSKGETGPPPVPPATNGQTGGMLSKTILGMNRMRK